MDLPLTFVVPTALIEATGQALAQIGERAVEGVVVWVGRRPAHHTVQVLHAIVPHQIAFSSDEGLAVTIPDWAVSELIDELEDGTYIPIRVHSHPGEAYHSTTDDRNRLLSHRGAISIVVPDFARAGMNLATCSVNELGEDFRWHELAADEVARRFCLV
jgi:hypothetical protein